MPITTTVLDIIRPALRMAGITKRPGIIPSPDQSSELIGELNSMLQSWNCDGQRIFSTKIELFPLVSGQKEYSIGPGGDFDTARPQFIRDANLVWPTNPLLRTPIKLLDEHEWSLIAMQNIANAIPWSLFYNPTYGTTGRGRIYIAFQPPDGYSLELFTWTLLDSFTSISDFVYLPDGYDDALKKNLAVRAAALYPWEANNDPVPEKNRQQLAYSALQRLRVLNTKCPTLRSEAEFLSRNFGWYWSGMFAGAPSSGGGEAPVYLTIDGAINGTNGSDGNAIFTLSQSPVSLQLFKNGVLQAPSGADAAYALSGSTVTFVAGQIPIVGDTLLAWGTVAQ